MGNPPSREFDHLYGRRLTARELQVLRGIAEGKQGPEVGRELFVAESTVKTHLRRVMAKLGARHRAHAVHLAHLQGLLGEEAKDG